MFHEIKSLYGGVRGGCEFFFFFGFLQDKKVFRVCEDKMILKETTYGIFIYLFILCEEALHDTRLVYPRPIPIPFHFKPLCWFFFA